MKLFSDRIISLRKENKITQTDLANAIHKQRSTISGYETGGKEPDYFTLCLLAEYFEVTVDYILGHNDERTHVAAVFQNDSTNFKKHYDGLPPELKVVVTELFDSFYVLLNRDMRNCKSESLLLYRDLINILKCGRSDLKHLISANSSEMNKALPQLFEAENRLKNDVAAVLDKLLETELNNSNSIDRRHELDGAE